MYRCVEDVPELGEAVSRQPVCFTVCYLAARYPSDKNCSGPSEIRCPGASVCLVHL